MAVLMAFDSIYHTAQSTHCSCSTEPTCIPQKSARSSCPDGEELYRSDRQADPYLPALVRSPCCSLHHLKNCECLTDHTLAHPLNCRGGVMAHPSAYCCTQVLNPGLTRVRDASYPLDHTGPQHLQYCCLATKTKFLTWRIARAKWPLKESGSGASGSSIQLPMVRSHARHSCDFRLKDVPTPAVNFRNRSTSTSRSSLV